MIEENDLKLIAELNKIVDRFGPESVGRLARMIRNPDTAADLATILERAATTRHTSKRRTKSKDSSRIGMAVLNGLRLSDPKKHAVVAELREQLMVGSVLGTMAEIRDFARINGFDIGNASSRNGAIPALLRSISELEIQDIETLINSLAHETSDNRSLERWRDIIVKPRT